MKGRSIKVASSKSPRKISVLPQQSAYPGATPRNNRSRQSPEKSNKSIAVSIKNGNFADLDAASKLQRGRSLMDELLAGLFGRIADQLNEKEKKQIVVMIQELDSMSEFEEYLKNYFSCYNYCYAAQITQENRNSVKVTQDFKQKRKVLMSSEKQKSKSKKKVQIQALNEENQQLKKQLFRLKQSNISLQKRILHLVAQYKDRKTIYLSQIQKLATLVNTTIKDIPQFIMKERPPLERQSLSAQKTLLPPELTLERKESEYNTLSSNDALRWGLENTYRVIDAQNLSRKGANLSSTQNYTERQY